MPSQVATRIHALFISDDKFEAQFFVRMETYMVVNTNSWSALSSCKGVEISDSKYAKAYDILLGIAYRSKFDLILHNPEAKVSRK